MNATSASAPASFPLDGARKCVLFGCVAIAAVEFEMQIAGE